MSDSHATTTGTEASSTACCDTGCCGGVGSAATHADPSSQGHDVRERVREGYAHIAKAGSWNATKQATQSDRADINLLRSDAPRPQTTPSSSCCGESASAGGGCCGPATFTPDQLARAIGYSAGELQNAPESANMGLSCGNPTALASLKPGEVVLDLGAGGGFDCFIAGPKVGATGRVIGVDMTPDMLSKARNNVRLYRDRTGLDNVEFRLGEIEHLPVADSSVDAVISNCVLNLSPDKPKVWREIARVLKPGGRASVSDLALLRPLPNAVLQDIEALVGCVAGAELVEQTRANILAAGLEVVEMTSKPQYIDAMTNWEDPLYRRIIEQLPAGSTPSQYITSLDIRAVRRA